jgi:hypothetical protein
MRSSSSSVAALPNCPEAPLMTMRMMCPRKKYQL